MVEHERPSSNKTKNKSRRTPSPTTSKVNSPSKDHDSEAASYDNESDDARTEKEFLSQKRKVESSSKNLISEKKKGRRRRPSKLLTVPPQGENNHNT